MAGNLHGAQIFGERGCPPPLMSEGLIGAPSTETKITPPKVVFGKRPQGIIDSFRLKKDKTGFWLNAVRACACARVRVCTEEKLHLLKGKKYISINPDPLLHAPGPQ